MDPEFWASRVTAARRNTSLHTDQYFCIDDLEGEDDTRIDFLCPYCYLDFDIASLCCHVEDEHSFETTSVVCPVCTTNVGSDFVGHITRQHNNLFKVQRRRKYLKGGLQSTSALGRERGLMGGALSRSDGSIGAPDPLLSAFICGLAPVQKHEQQKTSSPVAESSGKDSTELNADISTDSSVSNEGSKEMLEEGIRRAEFMQQLVLSAFLPDEF